VAALQAFADDYAYVIAGLLDLYGVTGDVAHLQVSNIANSSWAGLGWQVLGRVEQALNVGLG